jgi:NAD(P)-dependent dehydrogenase (short-subunit alcohol dehydrogenase family)
VEIKDYKTLLQGKTALVTGAGKGIGAAIAKGLGACGVTVFCLARTSSDIRTVAAEIVSAGGEAQALVGDVTNADDMFRAVEIISEASDTLDIAFLNAGANLYCGSIAGSDIASISAVDILFLEIIILCYEINRGSNRTYNAITADARRTCKLHRAFGFVRLGRNSRGRLPRPTRKRPPGPRYGSPFVGVSLQGADWRIHP